MLRPPDPESDKGRLGKGSPEIAKSEREKHSYTIPPEIQELAAQARKAFYNKPRTNECCSCAVDAADEVAFLRADDLVTQWELADPRDRWRHTGEPPPPEQEIQVPRPYWTAQSTVDAFFGWIVRQDDATQARWLADHPMDAPYLLELWRQKCKLQSK